MRDKRIKQLEVDFADTQQQYTECYDEVSHAQCEITCNQAVLLPLKNKKIAPGGRLGVAQRKGGQRLCSVTNTCAHYVW